MAAELRLTSAIREAIVEHARQDAPREVCGLLAGKDGEVSRVIRCSNVHATPTTRYAIDPREQLKAFRSMDAAGEELVGIYHSHPASQPYPSPTDRAESHYPDAVYIVVSLRSNEPEVRAFRLKADGFVREVALRS